MNRHEQQTERTHQGESYTRPHDQRDVPGYPGEEPYRGFNRQPNTFDTGHYGNPGGGVEYGHHEEPGLGAGRIEDRPVGQAPNQYEGHPQVSQEGFRRDSDREFRQGYRFADTESPPRAQPYPHSSGWQQQYKQGYGQQQPFGSNAQQPYGYEYDTMGGAYTRHALQNQGGQYADPTSSGRSDIRNYNPGQMQGGWGAGSQHGVVYGTQSGVPNRSEWSQTGAGNRYNPNQGPKNYRRSDDRIMEDICETVCHQPNLDCTDVEVEVKDCNVTLKGNVRERWMKHLVEDIADDTRGVREVENNVRVSRGADEESASGSEHESRKQTSGSKK